MPTPAQIAANIANAQASTGPRTAEGKATSSQNGVKLGLFASRDFVRPEEQQAYADLNAELLRDLAPVGVLERNLVDEIRRAMWRLRRCGDVEANLILRLDDHRGYVFDPMEAVDPAAEKIQRSVDRARAQAHRLLHKCTAELRRLQTDRHFAQELFAEDADTSDTGIADWRAITKARRPLVSVARDSSKAASAASEMPLTNQTRSEAQEAQKAA
jgi:hypothetical protein